MHSFMTSFPEAERKGIFVLALEDDRLISNVEGEAANWELTLGQHAPQTPQIPIPIGTSGSTGTGGTVGTSGTTGTTGTSGTSGTSGTTGTTGTSGTSGTTGATGTSGTTGSTGTSGTSGSTGSTGTVGDDPGQCQDWNSARPPGAPAQACGCEGFPAWEFARHDPDALRGANTGIFYRVTSVRGYSSVSSMIYLPASNAIKAASTSVNGRIVFDAPHIYHSGEYDRTINGGIFQRKYEGGFKYDSIPMPGAQGLGWKPYLAWWSTGASYAQKQIEGRFRQLPAIGMRLRSDLRATFMWRNGVWQEVIVTRFSSSSGATLSGSSPSIALGKIEPQSPSLGSAWTIQPAHTRMNRIIGIAQTPITNAAPYLNRQSELCGAQFLDSSLGSGSLVNLASFASPHIAQAVAAPNTTNNFRLPSVTFVSQHGRQPGSHNNGEPGNSMIISILLGENP